MCFFVVLLLVIPSFFCNNFTLVRFELRCYRDFFALYIVLSTLTHPAPTLLRYNTLFRCAFI